MKLPGRTELSLVGRFTRKREREHAEAARADERERFVEQSEADERRFRRRMDALSSVPHISLGQTATGTQYRIALPEFTSLPSWITAATGAGKSRFVGSLMSRVIELLLDGTPVALVVVDGKGETADAFLRHVAHEARKLSRMRREEFLNRLFTLRFFDSQYLPSWPLLHPMPGVRIASQADLVAEVLTDVAPDATVGPRQRAALSAILALAIERGIPAARLPWLLSAPGAVAAMASQSSIPSVRLDLSRFEREPQGSIDGLIARLGILLRVPTVKAVLSGTEPLDFGRCLEPGTVTVVSFDGNAGARSTVRAVGSIVLSAIASAAFDSRRTVAGNTLIVLDEPQAFASTVSLGQMERLVTLGRSFGVGGLSFIHQGATQLPQELQTILNTNVPLRILGRSARADAQAAAEWLPTTGRVPRRRELGADRMNRSRFLSEAEESRFRVSEVGRLPARHFLVSDRRTDFAPRIVRSETYDPPSWGKIDPAIAEAVKRGAVGVPRAELEARADDIEQSAAEWLDEVRESDAPRRGRRRRPPETPDVLTNEPKGRRGIVP